MSGNLPGELKQIAPYIQRGQEMAGVDPVVSYFCKYYAARLAIGSGATSPESQAYLSSLLDELETEKERIKDHAVMQNDAVALQHCTTFALKVFARADTEDREGRATKVTARNFMVASQFLQMLSGFGELSEDVKEKVKYAKWKAADILKALREGREPTNAPGTQQQQQSPVQQPPQQQPLSQPQSPPQQQAPSQQQQQAGVTANDIFAWPSPPPAGSVPQQPAATIPPAATTQAVPPPQSVVQNSHFDSLPSVPTQPHISTNATGSSSTQTAPVITPVTASRATFVPVPASNLPAPMQPSSSASSAYGQQMGGELTVDPMVTKNAQKMARWAISALEYDDVDNAISNLQKAIEMLQPYRQQR